VISGSFTNFTAYDRFCVVSSNYILRWNLKTQNLQVYRYDSNNPNIFPNTLIGNNKNPIPESDVSATLQGMLPKGWKIGYLMNRYCIAWDPFSVRYKILQFLYEMPLSFKEIQNGSFPLDYLNPKNPDSHEVVAFTPDLLMDWNPTSREYIIYDLIFNENSFNFDINVVQSGFLEEADIECSFVPINNNTILYWNSKLMQHQLIQLDIGALIQTGHVQTKTQLSGYNIYWLGKERIMLYNPSTKNSIHGNLKDILEGYIDETPSD
jgi:hypothetical protein